MAVESLIFYTLAAPHFLASEFVTESTYRQTLVYAQIAVSISMLVFVSRTDGPFFLDRPGTGLLLSSLGGMVVATCISGFGIIVPRAVAWRDLGLVWLYNAMWMLVLDAFKLLFLWLIKQEETITVPVVTCERLIARSKSGLAAKEDPKRRDEEEVKDSSLSGPPANERVRLPSVLGPPSPSVQRVHSFELQRLGMIQHPTPGHHFAGQRRPMSLAYGNEL